MRHSLKYIALILALIIVGAAGDHIVGGWQIFASTAWEDLRFPASKGLTGATNPPTFAQWADDGSGSPGVYALYFSDQSVAGNEEQFWVQAQSPHSRVLNSDVCPHIHWTLEDTTSCNARFCVESLFAPIGIAWPATTTTVCADCASGGDRLHHLCDLGALSTSSDTISSMFSQRVYRNSSHANDTCTGKDAVVFEYDIHYEMDTRGSRSEDTK